MTKIVTKLQKVFAATGPTGVLGQFGSYAEGAPVYTDDVEEIQALSNYGVGLVSALVNGAPPAMQDINGLFYMILKQIAYLMQQGIPEWNADTTYYIGSFVTRPDGTDGEVFMSVADDNLNNALSDTDYWMIYDSKKITVTTSNSYNILYNDFYVSQQYAGDTTIFLPKAVPANKGRIVNIYIGSASIQPSSNYYAYVYATDSLIDNKNYFKTVIGNTGIGIFPTIGVKFISTGSQWYGFDAYYGIYQS